jgi:hypothetical protein
MRTVVAVFPSRNEAEHLAKHLEAIGIPNEEVNIAGPDADRHDRTNGEWTRRNLAATAASGWGWTLAWTIPLIADRTRLAASFVGAGLGAAAGFLIAVVATFVRGAAITDASSIVTILLAMLVAGFLAGFAAETYSRGVSHESEALCEEAVREHGVVIAAHIPEEREAEALRLMEEHGATGIHADANAWLASGWKGPIIDEEPYPSDSSIVSHVAGR